MWRRSLKVAYRSILYTVATLLVLFAVFLTFLRYLLPSLPDVTAQVEQFALSQYQLDTRISELSADWSTAGPQLILHNLKVQPLGGQPTLVTITEARVHFDFWQSVQSWSLQFERVTLEGARIEYDLRQAVTVANTDVPAALSRLFLNQLDYVIIEDSAVELINLLGVKRRIDIERLSWMNRGARHQGIGKFRIADFNTNALDIIIDINGQNPDALDGQIYISAENLNVAPWLQQQVIDSEVGQAQLNFTLWLNFADSIFNDGALKLGENTLHWQVAEQKHQIKIPEGVLKLRPRAGGWLVNNAPLTVIQNGSSWELPSFSWRQHASGFNFSIDDVPLRPLLNLLTVTGSTGAVLHNELAGRQAAGQVSLRMQQNLDDELRWQLNGEQLRWQHTPSVPGLDAVSLAVYGEGLDASWELQGNDIALRSDQLDTEQPWLVDKLQLQGDWQWLAGNWQLTVAEDSRLGLEGLPLGLAARLTSENGHLGLRTRVIGLNEQPIPAAVLRRYLPAALGADLQDYLLTALLEGEAESLAMVWRGSLAEFPYQNYQGQFAAQANIDGLRFKFHPDWQPLYDASARVNFSNQRMHIQARDGKLGDASLPLINTITPDLSVADAWLAIDSQIVSNSAALQPIFAASPLAGSLGETLTELQLSGSMRGQLELTIPLQEGADVLAAGHAQLDDNQLDIAMLSQQFSAVTGRINFRNEHIESNDLTLRWQELPVSATLTSDAAGEDYKVSVGMSGNWNLDEAASLSDTAMVGGAFDWDAELELVLAADDGYSFHWRQASDLNGLTLNLPAPLNKAAGESWPWQLQVSGSEDSILINGGMADRAMLELQLNGNASELQQGFMRLGEEQAAIPNPNVTRVNAKFPVEIHVDRFDLQQWLDAGQSLINAFIGPADSDELSSVFSVIRPDLIQLTADEFSLLGHQLTDFSGVAWPEDDTWRMRVQAEQTSLVASLGYGDAEAAETLQLTVDAEYIELAKPLAVDDALVEQPNLSQVPTLTLRCKRCSYAGFDLGALELDLAPVNQGIEVSSLRIQQGQHLLDASGTWQIGDTAEQQRTSFTGNFSSADLGAFLRDYDISTMVQDSPADFKFELNWQGAPFQYNHESLNGTVTWSLGQGYLNEVSDGAARIFSLLSLESILRKLRFDFRDVFANGLFFTQFGGEFNIKNGRVRTNNTVLNGSAGDMEISGVTNLVSEEINYQLYYIPKVTSSLPVILAWMVNPPSGLAALLLDRMLHDAQVISRLEYRISGTLDEPIIEEVSRSSREVPIPAPEQEIPDEPQPTEEQPPASTDDGRAADEQSGSARESGDSAAAIR
ncbi:YhdP family protein [Pseudidiomarina sp.]|uniref:YhdP family protein n=1 Tax=Pseudidiomarina sp. TaxID=2081707 RepID=UPI00299EE350|nr:YhdP family protein [Pseudidiomarina sp.]MDX1706292.1 YhdP family protein [Pseudidiomarina sp.]